MSQMLKSSGAMAAATLTSRLLGMVREIVYARFMGDNAVAGAFKFAFTVPNLFRRLLGEGALTAAFIPIFKTKESTAGETEMWRAANAVISGLVVSAAVIVGVVMLGISLALAVHHFSEDTTLMLELLRLMFPYMLVICLTAVFMGMLNARGYFFVPAMGAAVLNTVMIAAVYWLTPLFGTVLETRIFGLAVGVLVAGLAQAAFQVPQLRREGFRFHWVSPWRDETVRAVIRKMIPGTLGVAAFQLNVVLTNLLAIHLVGGLTIVASFDYAVRVMELPQGVFGISLATYLLPTLSRLAAEKQLPEFRSTLGQGIGHLLLANLLASALLLVLAEPIIRLLFERGSFHAGSTARAAQALACLAPGLVLFSLVNILARAFYALGDTQTPMKISVFCLAANLLFAGWLVGPYRQSGLGVANTLSAALNVSLLFYALRRKLGRLELHAVTRTLRVLLPAAALAGGVAWTASRYWERTLNHTSLPGRIGAVFVPMLAAALFYGGVTWWGRVPAAREMALLLSSKLRRPPA